MSVIYRNHEDETKATLTVEAVKVPGGVLYITVMHPWKQLSTCFVKSENVIKEPKAGCPEKIWDFLGPKEEETPSEH